MHVLRLFSTLFIAVFAWLVLSLGLLSLPAHAQDQSDVQKIINNGLCNGSNLQFSGQCSINNQNGTDRATQTVHKLVNTLSAIVAVVAVVMIIVGGLRYITSGGSDASVTSAKNTILYAIVGLVIVALAQVLVHFVLKQVS